MLRLKILNRHKHFVKDSMWYLSSSMLVALIGILINPLMAKNLSPDDYAIIGFFSSFSTIIIPMSHFSMLSYFLRNYFLIDENKRDLMSDTILISLIFIGFIAVSLFIIIMYYYCKYAKSEFDFFPYAILTYVQLFIMNFVTFYLYKLKIKKEAKKYTKITILNCIVTTILSIILVVNLKYGADGKLYAVLISTIIFAIYSFRKSISKWQFDYKILINALKFGLPLTISAFFWYFLAGIDRLLLANLNDLYNYGIYCVALQISGYLTIFYTTLNNTFDPDIYKAIAENNVSKITKIMLAIVIITALANLLFIILAPFLIGILTANRYIESTSFAQILALSNITLAMYYLVIKLLVGYGYVKYELIVRIIGAGISFLIFKILIDNYGFYGAAWGQVSSFLMISILGISMFVCLRQREISLTLKNKNNE